MERRRLKTVMILILALTNLFLVVWQGRRYLDEQSARHRTQERITALFAADGMTLSPKAVAPQNPCESVLLRWNEEMETDLASFFLGGRVRSSNDGGIREYVADAPEPDNNPPATSLPNLSGNTNTDFGKYPDSMDIPDTSPNAENTSDSMADTRSTDLATDFPGGADVIVRFEGGEFDVSGLNVREGAAEWCFQFCREWNLNPPESFDVENGVVSAGTFYGDIPVPNCSVKFLFRNSILREVSGMVLPQEGIPLHTDTTPLSTLGALTVFQTRQREHRSVISAVTEIQPCLLIADYPSVTVVPPPVESTVTLSLYPGWRIVTDTVPYYVNCMTGTVALEG